MKKLIALTLALLMLVSCTALAESTQPAPANPALNNELVIGSTTPLSGYFFTEMWGNNTADNDVRMLLHGYSLMEWRSAIGAYGINESVVSGLAVTEDAEGNRTYTLSLYNDLYYSDGTQITASDYVFSILLSMSPEVAEIGGQTVQGDHIVGSDNYKRRISTVLSGVRLISDTMLSITVKAEYQPFFYELALLNYNPYPIHVIAPGCIITDDTTGTAIRNRDVTANGRIFTAALLQETILNPDTGYQSHPSVVSGPYMLESFDWGSRTASFVINPYFKGNAMGQKPTIKRLVLRTVSNDTMMQQLASGEINLINKCVAADAITSGMQLVGNGELGVANYPRSGFSFISFNCERPATSSQAVRQAIAHCLDKDALTAAYVSNYGIRVDGYYGIGQWLYELVSGTITEYEQEGEDWTDVTLDNVPVYDLDLNAAIALLEGDGFTLNRTGSTFDPSKDDVRCKQEGGQLIPLDLTLIYPQGNAIGGLLDSALTSNLAQAGVRLTVKAAPMSDLLDVYYRNVERDCDMIYLATNFSAVFDPAPTFSPDDAYIGSTNRTSINDDQLYNLAVDMNRTQPGDLLSYCRKWVAFQERWAQVLPSIPIYSNVYFDFYTPMLQNYLIGSSMTWSQAIVGAYLGELAAQPEEDELSEEFVLIED